MAGRCHACLRAVWGGGCLGSDRSDCDCHGRLLGIGAATAQLLHQSGAHPILAARRDDRLQSLSRELNGELAVPTDVTDRAAIARLVEATLDRYNRIDGLVNNAGVGLYKRLDELDLEEFSRVLDLNVVSLVAMTQAVCCQRCGLKARAGSSTTARAPRAWCCPV